MEKIGGNWAEAHVFTLKNKVGVNGFPFIKANIKFWLCLFRQFRTTLATDEFEGGLSTVPVKAYLKQVD
jgi:hypothetical protein